MTKTNLLLLSGLFSALTGICSWINIPLFFTPVPINLALIGPYMAGSLLGPRYGLLSQIIYIMTGALGIPVFAGFSGGLGVLAGPTGGFIIGYAVCAFICGLGAKGKITAGRPPKIAGSAAFMFIGLSACYSFGLMWYMIVTGASLWSGLAACVLPFLPGDMLKIAVAAVMSQQIAKPLSL